MDWFWLVIHIALIIDINSLVLRDEKCQLYAGFFDWVLKGKFNGQLYYTHNDVNTLTQCISKCVHHKTGLVDSDGQVVNCKSINYHAGNRLCEVLGEEMKDFLLEHIFDGPSTKYKPDEDGWLHYSGDPNRRLVS